MNYPKLLQKGDTIGVRAPSGGASGEVLQKAWTRLSRI